MHSYKEPSDWVISWQRYSDKLVVVTSELNWGYDLSEYGEMWIAVEVKRNSENFTYLNVNSIK